MRAAVASDVIADVLLSKNEESLGVMQAAVRGEAELYVTLAQLTEIHTIASSKYGVKEAKRLISDLAFIFRILPEPKGEKLMAAFNSDRFTDAVLMAAAEEAKIDTIITGERGRFGDSRMNIMHPRAFLRGK